MTAQTENKRKFIDAYMWMFGETKRKAASAYRETSEEYHAAVIETWLNQCHLAFYND